MADQIDTDEIGERLRQLRIPLPAPDHAEVNVQKPGLYHGFSDINSSVISRNVTKYQPRSFNRIGVQAANVPNVSGQVEFQLTTSNMHWMSLFDSHFRTTFTLAVPGDRVMHLTQNMISQAYLYINGIQVAFTNNWTVASQVNKRMQFSKQYNQSINEMTYRSDINLATAALLEAAATAGGHGPAGAGYNNALPEPVTYVPAAGTYVDKEYLDGFFIRDRNSCFIPPNSEVRIVLTIDPTYPLKVTRTPHVAVATTIDVVQMEFVATTLVKAEPVPQEYILKFITNSITTSSSNNTTDMNRQLTVNPNIVRVALVCQDSDFATEAIDKTAGGEVLSYPTQNEKVSGTRVLTGAVGAAQINSLQFQLGSQVVPPQAYDFSAAGGLHRDAYEQYLQLTGKSLSYETQESFLDWLTEPIYLANFERPVEDKSTNLIIRATRLNGGALNVMMHIIEMDEQLVSFTFDPTSGACISTQTVF